MATIILFGAIVFNVNSADGMVYSFWTVPHTLANRLSIWFPSTLGALCFVIGGYMQVIEQVHCWWKFQYWSVAFWSAFWNLLGGISFFVASINGFYLDEVASQFGVNLIFLIGSWCFLFGSYCTAIEGINAN
jgi:hypothetical protein